MLFYPVFALVGNQIDPELRSLWFHHCHSNEGTVVYYSKLSLLKSCESLK